MERTIVYIGNLAPGVTMAELGQHAALFGRITDMKYFSRRGYAFIQVYPDFRSSCSGYVWPK